MSDEGRVRVMSCAEVQDLASELGLGVLGGVERASALAHLESCPSCAALVGSMAHIGDSLLSLGPDVEPPPGFETRLLARVPSAPKPGGRRRRWQLLAAGAAIVAAAAGVGFGVGNLGRSGFRVESPGVLAAVGGRDLSVAMLRQDGQQVGQVFVYAGQPSWVFMTVEVDGSPRRLTCEIETRAGGTVTLGSFTVTRGYASWGSTVTIDPSTIRGIRVVGAGNNTVATATL